MWRRHARPRRWARQDLRPSYDFEAARALANGSASSATSVASHLYGRAWSRRPERRGAGGVLGPGQDAGHRRRPVPVSQGAVGGLLADPLPVHLGRPVPAAQGHVTTPTTGTCGYSSGPQATRSRAPTPTSSRSSTACGSRCSTTACATPRATPRTGEAEPERTRSVDQTLWVATTSKQATSPPTWSGRSTSRPAPCPSSTTRPTRATDPGGGQRSVALPRRRVERRSRVFQGSLGIPRRLRRRAH